MTEPQNMLRRSLLDRVTRLPGRRAAPQPFLSDADGPVYLTNPLNVAVLNPGPGEKSQAGGNSNTYYIMRCGRLPAHAPLAVPHSRQSSKHPPRTAQKFFPPFAFRHGRLWA
jgi:hypothetical protein